MWFFFCFVNQTEPKCHFYTTKPPNARGYRLAYFRCFKRCQSLVLRKKHAFSKQSDIIFFNSNDISNRGEVEKCSCFC